MIKTFIVIILNQILPRTEERKNSCIKTAGTGLKRLPCLKFLPVADRNAVNNQ